MDTLTCRHKTIYKRLLYITLVSSILMFSVESIGTGERIKVSLKNYTDNAISFTSSIDTSGKASSSDDPCVSFETVWTDDINIAMKPTKSLPLSGVKIKK